MLDSYGLHELVWDACDERFSDILVASPADAGGRGISLAVREDGAAAIGSELAAEVYQLKLLEQGIQDNPNNTTRFLIVGSIGTIIAIVPNAAIFVVAMDIMSIPETFFKQLVIIHHCIVPFYQ